MTTTSEQSSSGGAPAGPAAARPPAIQVRGLVKRYGGRTVVDRLDLTVRSGEIFGLLGPNGAGKSTTVEILAGLRRADQGELSVLGLDPAQLRPADRNRIGLVAQTGNERPLLTVREMIRQFAAYAADPWDVDELIETVGLTAKARARLGSLSGGQRRRVDVAIGIVSHPELLFLDEPTTGFDPQARREFWGLIESLREGGTTILLTSHYLDEVEQLADRVAVITSGRLRALGTVGEIQACHGERPLVRWDDAEGHHERRTSEPTAVLRAILPSQGELQGLEIIRPTLEDTYLGLIG